MKRLLMICPTRNRPDRVLEMLKSFKDTRTFAEIIFYVADDDLRIGEYRANLSTENVIYGPRIPLVQVVNMFSSQGDYAYSGVINDDHIFHTPGWDKAFVDAIESRGRGWGVAFGNTNDTPYWQPSGEIMSVKTIRTLGFYFPPDLEHLFVDRALIDIFKDMNLLHKVKSVDIEHRHWAFKKAEIDQNYKELYQDEANYNRQEQLYLKWKKEKLPGVIERLRKAMEAAG